MNEIIEHESHAIERPVDRIVISPVAEAIHPFYQDESVTIYHGDCLDVLPLIGFQVDMVLCDLPYGSTNHHWDSLIPLKPLWAQYERLCKENAAMVFTAQQPFATDLITSNRNLFRYEWVWEKTMPLGYVNANRMPLKAHEQILVFYKSLPIYNPQMSKGTPYSERKRKPDDWYRGYSKNVRTNKANHGERFPKSVLKFSNSNKDKIAHPTRKPIALFKYLISTYTNEGGLILDNCMGSGTTLLAAKELGRRAIGIEREEQYCQIAVERLAQNMLAFSEAI